jgi:DNA polymerase
MTVGHINRQLAEKCNGLTLHFDCLADGSADAEIAIVAEAPGERECDMKLPLVGKSGQIVWRILDKIGVRRQQCYITNVVKRRLASLSGPKQGISRNEEQHWHALVRWELKQLPNLRYVIVMGNKALEALIGDSGIELWRGTVKLVDGVHYIITYNAAHVIHKPSLELILHHDVLKLDLVRSGRWQPHDITPILNPSPTEVREWCDRMISENKPVSFDIETIGGETACIGLTNDKHTGMCVAFRTRDTHVYSLADETRIRYDLQRVLRHPRVQLVAQNGAFDCGWLWYKDRMKVQPLYMDTMLAHHTLFPTWPHSLAFMTTQYTTHPYYKDEKNTWREGGNITQFWEYNVKDVCITLACAEALERELKQQKLWDFFTSHVMRLQPVLIDMTVLGNRIDLDMKAQLAARFEQEVETLRQQFVQQAADAVNDPTLIVNPLSNQQLADWMFRRGRVVGRNTSVDASNRDYIITSPRTSPAIREALITLNRFKEQHKLLSTYITAKVDEDGRMRSDYSQAGVVTAPGRLSSRKTLWDSGMNLQNQPESLRGMFVADPGCCYVYFDMAQAEARIVAWEAPIPKWQHQFELARLNPGTYDAHCALASEMWGIPYDEVPKKDWDPVTGKHTIRYVAKRCRHGLNYRMQAPRLAQTAGLSLSDAIEAYNAYHHATPELRKWWKDVIEEARKNRMVFNCYGRRLVFLGSTLDDELLDALIAFKPQSGLGDHVCRVMYMSHSDPQWPIHARIVFNNHDSLTAMCRIPDAKRVAAIMKKHAETPLRIKGQELIIPAELKISQPDEKGIHRWNSLQTFTL